MKKNIEKNETYLITTDHYFVAPNGRQYKSVFGTIKGVNSSEETLGIKTNSRSTNWYVSIGNMIVAGCQIQYAIKCKWVNLFSAKDCTWGGKNGYREFKRLSVIYNADKES